MQDRLKSFSLEKRTFINIFLITTLILAVMPFITTFNDLLTRLIMGVDAYRVIQNFVVPWEIRMVGVILYPFGLRPQIFGEYLAIGNPSRPFLIEIIWNCVGWQSLLFFSITALVGLQGDRYTSLSKLKALAIGLSGTFLVNLLRIAVVSIVAYWFGQNVAIIFHDYGSTLAVIGWLFGFWWFAYSFVLEAKEEGSERHHTTL